MTLNLTPSFYLPVLGFQACSIHLMYLVLGIKPTLFVCPILLKFRANLCLNSLYPIHCTLGLSEFLPCLVKLLCLPGDLDLLLILLPGGQNCLDSVLFGVT